jgi:hypothetical protein
MPFFTCPERSISPFARSTEKARNKESVVAIAKLHGRELAKAPI